MELGHWQKFQKLYIYSISTHRVEIKLTFTLPAAVSEISQFSKTTTSGHETWTPTKVAAVGHTLFLPQGVEIELIFALRAAVSEIYFRI